MFRNILVPLDGSTFGEHALPLAASIARAANATLHVVHIHRTLEATYAELQVFDSTLDQDLRKHENQYLADIKRRLERTLPGKVAVVNREGPTTESLLKHAAEVSADVVVLTTHARGMLGRFWLGSVADEMIRQSPIPLLMVHPGGSRPDFDHDVLPRNILVPLDGTVVAERILPATTALAKLSGGTLSLLRILGPMFSATPAAGMFGNPAGTMLVERLQDVHTQLRNEAATYLKGVADRLRGEGFQVTTEVAAEDQPGVGILNHARAPIDMIAIKTHGRRGLSRLVMGSVADKVIRGTTLPVLVQRPQES
jgi:nucleotide-binding universal stress UspA family protein